MQNAEFANLFLFVLYVSGGRFWHWPLAMDGNADGNGRQRAALLTAMPTALPTAIDGSFDGNGWQCAAMERNGWQWTGKGWQWTAMAWQCAAVEGNGQ